LFIPTGEQRVEMPALSEVEMRDICLFCARGNSLLCVADMSLTSVTANLGYTCFDSALALLQNRIAALPTNKKYFAAHLEKPQQIALSSPKTTHHLCQTTTMHMALG